MHTCYLIGAAPDAAPVVLEEGDYVIAADGGCDTVRKWGLLPDFVVGDFDSMLQPAPSGVTCKKVPAEKDDTDLALALREGLDRGYRRFELIGAAGGRPDHTFANMQLLVKAASLGAFAVMRQDGFSTAALTENGSLKLRGSGKVSVFSFGGQAKGVTLRGLKYPLVEAELTQDKPVGVSNEIVGGEAEISLENGVLLVFWEDDGIQPLVNV
ncbi:MAG: thiamine diphosphokinase [Oscillospiraceae bacterium]|nr:thiamine diphosphokinase [Oscillospiraceae bacterium]